MKIVNVWAREVLDSRGNPTVEADVVLESGVMGRAIAPSGASTGSHEAHELRDADPARYGGKGVLKAVKNVISEIAPAVVGMQADEQHELDERMKVLDGTHNKSRLGANAILAVSLAFAHAAAKEKNAPLFTHLADISGTKPSPVLPLPMCNIINGGTHAAGSTDIQEFMIMPIGAERFSHAVQMMAEVFHALKKVLHEKGYGTTTGDEGGFAPAVRKGNREVLQLISEAVEKAGYRVGRDIVFALDVASTELFVDGTYRFQTENKTVSSEELIMIYHNLAKEFPIVSIEDGLAEHDWDGWKKLTENMGGTTQLVGDDLLVTNPEFLERGIKEKAGNAILVKPNQIGTLSETILVIGRAKEAGWNTVVSHRSGESEDTTIAHLAVGLAAGQIKTGSMSRTDRIAKYNELLRIEELLGDKAAFQAHI